MDAGPQTLAGKFRSLTRSHLPLNRKERYYTGTVLPMLVASDGFAHLDRFLALCGLPDVHVPGSRNGEQALEFFTEFGFHERVRDEDRPRFPDLTGRDTPDLVIAGDDWLLAVEAKMFHRPTSAAMNRQADQQRLVIDTWVRALPLRPDRVAHVWLLPEELASAVRGSVHIPVVTWQEVLRAYRVVGPAYWVGVLEEALTRYTDLVAEPMTFGANPDDYIPGGEVVEGYGREPFRIGTSGGAVGSTVVTSAGMWSQAIGAPGRTRSASTR